ncbi:MAG: O-antigen ligase family protein [Gammaproteobacteria bacterium]|nr:O-antigen ligase family protein [Gammaproteobacteria bacterium]MCP5137518.1 O-antigen ligase family protein [Gammaproteobacteria bacterium]
MIDTESGIDALDVNVKRQALALNVLRIATFLYVFALPFNHNAAIKNLALLGVLIGLVLARGVRLDWRSPVVLALLAILGTALFSTLLGTAVLEDLNAYRKHFLPPLLIFLAVFLAFSDMRWLRMLLLIMLAAFSVRAGFALYEALTSSRDMGWAWKGFSLEAAMYIPLAVGGLMVMRRSARWSAAVVVALGIAAVLAIESRTTLVAVLSSALVIWMVRGQWRGMLVFLLCFGLIAGSVLALKPKLVERYSSIFSSHTYQGAEALSNRAAIWRGVWEVAADRPVIGHGFGWKKLGRTAVGNGHVARWKQQTDAESQFAAWYFSLPSDKVNPHNLGLELLFETGWLGLLVYLGAVLTLIWQSVRLVFISSPEWQPVGAMVVGFWTGYLIMNFGNSLWLGSGPSAIVLGILAVLWDKARIGEDSISTQAGIKAA